MQGVLLENKYHSPDPLDIVRLFDQFADGLRLATCIFIPHHVWRLVNGEDTNYSNIDT